MPTTGYRQLSRQLTAMGAAAGGRALRSAANRSMLPAVHAARAAAPVGSPPYSYASGSVDPYPRKTYKGRLVTPGFTARNILRKSVLSRDRSTARVFVGVAAEAFYAVLFHELGTSRRPPSPWLEPAFRRSLPRINALLGQYLRQNIDKAARR